MKKIHIPAGFIAGGMGAGIKAPRKPDLAMILCEGPAVVTAMTTTNQFPAAPVLVTRERLASRSAIRGVVVSSGNANAVTGRGGLEDARRMTRWAEEATGSPAGSFLVASTGVIGKRLPMEKIRKGIARLGSKLTAEGWIDFAEAILTTDKSRKVSSRSIELSGGRKASILGITKGAGMIHPKMATTLTFILTDFQLTARRAQGQFRRVIEASFNCLSVDGQTSTNDTAILMSSRRAGIPITPPNWEFQVFEKALRSVCRDLAQSIAADGEGATKFVTIRVKGASSNSRARILAFSVANSVLVKTALFGELPNWGRIIQALGQVGIRIEPSQVNLKIQNMAVVRRGAPVDFSPADLRRAMKRKDITIEATVGSGKGNAEVWTCDLGHEYVRFNTEYN